MEIEFDPGKDAANIEKHGLSLAGFDGFDGEFVAIPDNRFAEPRFRAFGRIDGIPHCVAFTLRGDKVRLISFRRAHEKEMRRYE